MIEVASRRMECTLLTSNYSQMPAVALQFILLLCAIVIKKICNQERVNKIPIQEEDK